MTAEQSEQVIARHREQARHTEDAIALLPAPARELVLRWRPVVEAAGRYRGLNGRLLAEFVRDVEAAVRALRQPEPAPGKVAGEYQSGSGV